MTQSNEHPRCILALDLGTTTGWALRSHEGLITSGTASFRPGRYDGGGMRYLRFTNWLTELDRLSGPIAAIWFEEVRRHAGTDAAHIYGGLMRDALRHILLGGLIAAGMGSLSMAIITRWLGLPPEAIPAGGAAGSAAYLVGVFGPAFIEVLLARLRQAGKGDGDA